MRKLLPPLLCLVLTACATIEPVPYARPLTQSSIDAIGATPVSVTGNEQGVSKAWFYTDVNGGGAGIAGAIGAAIASAIINAAPSARAHRQAEEVAEVRTVEGLNDSLVTMIKDEAAKGATGPGVTISGASLTYKSVTPGELDDVVEITTHYTLSEDFSVLRVVATATYSNRTIPYTTRYTFVKAVPKSETKGPVYRNTFTYYSTPLPIPTLTPELRERLVANIRESAQDANGAPPVDGTKEYKSMQREIEQAGDDKLTNGEISVFLTREWLSNDGARIKAEVRRAHDFVVRHVLLDLNRTAVPSLAGEDELLETAVDQRTVRRIGKGVEAGSYVSSASDVTSFATYGNTVAVSKRTVAYVKGLKGQPTKVAGRS